MFNEQQTKLYLRDTIYSILDSSSCCQNKVVFYF